MHKQIKTFELDTNGEKLLNDFIFKLDPESILDIKTTRYKFIVIYLTN